MTISLINTGKRFNREWIFRHLNFQLHPGTRCVITGPNGSGKSTLLQVISGAVSPSEGKIEYQGQSGMPALTPENSYQHIAITAPYLELVEEMTLLEFLHFHRQFKPLLASVTIENILIIIGLEKAANKQIRFFSSGMKQRVKLAQAIFSDTAVLLLDEPCTNLDKEGISLYHHLIQTYGENRMIIVSSNDEVEYSFCTEQLHISDYK